MINGVPLIEDRWIPREEVYVVEGIIYANPGNWITRGGRPPFWTSRMLGVVEAERYKRRVKKVSNEHGS